MRVSGYMHTLHPAEHQVLTPSFVMSSCHSLIHWWIFLTSSFTAIFLFIHLTSQWYHDTWPFIYQSQFSRTCLLLLSRLCDKGPISSSTSTIPFNNVNHWVSSNQYVHPPVIQPTWELVAVINRTKSLHPSIICDMVIDLLHTSSFFWEPKSQPLTG